MRVSTEHSRFFRAAWGPAFANQKSQRCRHSRSKAVLGLGELPTAALQIGRAGGLMATDLYERWLNGVELSFAWRTVPDEDLLDQYDASGDNFALREAVIFMMKRELAQRLGAREFTAIGFEVARE